MSQTKELVRLKGILIRGFLFPETTPRNLKVNLLQVLLGGIRLNSILREIRMLYSKPQLF